MTIQNDRHSSEDAFQSSGDTPRSGSRTRRFSASGVDDLGDVHTFSSDDRQRVEEVAEIMREDLEDVELRETSN